MNKKDLRIVFMGTPDFAVESLRKLVENGYNVVGVITMPDKPGGRGHKIQYSAVKKYAVEHDLPLLQPEKLKDEVFLNDLKAWNADLQIVVAFRMLPEVVWDMPRLGTFNLHGSLLPQYRGAAPINWAIINGEKETGVTTFFLTHEIDTGKIIYQEKISIADTDNAGDIHDTLMLLGANLVMQTVDAIADGSVQTIAQSDLILDGALLQPAPKIFRDTCRIDWNQPVQTVYNFIRGLSPYPGAWTELRTAKGDLQQFKLFETEKLPMNRPYPVGAVLTDNKTNLAIATLDGLINVLEIQAVGKKRMPISDFLRGNALERVE